MSVELHLQVVEVRGLKDARLLVAQRSAELRAEVRAERDVLQCGLLAADLRDFAHECPLFVTTFDGTHVGDVELDDDGLRRLVLLTTWLRSA
jgi:hypothetical protein